MIRTFDHLCYVLQTRPYIVEEIIDNIDSYYYSKQEEKRDILGRVKVKNGIVQLRTLTPSVNELKTIQTQIKNSIFAQVQLPPYAFGGVKGKDNIINAAEHRSNKFKFTTDLKDFFPSVSHHVLYETLRELGFSKPVARILTQLTTFKGQLPQGSPTSTFLANLVFSKPGNELSKFALKHDLKFTTFIDDLTLSGNRDFKSSTLEVIDVIRKNGFKINQGKTFYKTGPISITGVTIDKGKLFPPQRILDRMADRASLNDAQWRGLCGYVRRIDSLNN